MKQISFLNQLFKNKKQNRYYILLAVALVVTIVFQQLAPTQHSLQTNTTDQAHSSISSAAVPFTGENFDVFSKSTKYRATVRDITDGDTFYLQYGQQSFKARLLIVDAPETAKDGKPDQPYAQEALARVRELLANAATIEFAFDVGDYTDKYQRALVYLYIDGQLLQNILLEEGLVRIAYKYKPNITLVPEMEKYQNIAQKAKQNIWSRTGYVTNNGFNPAVFE